MSSPHVIKKNSFHKLIRVIRIFMLKLSWFSAIHEIFLTSNYFRTTVLLSSVCPLAACWMCLQTITELSSYVSVARARIIMIKILPVMFMSSAQKFTHYAENYAHHHCNYAIVHIQFYSIFNDSISIYSKAPAYCVSYHAMLQCSFILHIMLMRKLAPHFAPS